MCPTPEAGARCHRARAGVARPRRACSCRQTAQDIVAFGKHLVPNQLDTRPRSPARVAPRVPPTKSQIRHIGDRVNAVDLPELLVGDAGEWRRWLNAHHTDSPGVWLVLAKKGTVDPTTVSYVEALDEAICFGWIDGQLGRRDTTTFRRRFTPRKARSPWSQRNAAIAERLIAAGRMHRSGEDEVRQAKEDGRWEAAYAGQASIEVPEDLLAALSANPRATGDV